MIERWRRYYKSIMDRDHSPSETLAADGNRI